MLRIIALLAALMTAAHGDLARAQVEPRAAAVFAAAKAASGGAAWDALPGSYEKGEHSGRPYETWLNYRTYGMKVRSADGGIRGFDGKVAWERSPSGAVKVMTDGSAVREALLTAYVSNNGFLFPDRFAAKATYLRTVEEGGAKYDVLQVEPLGGRAVELWFDQGTHLLGRVVDRTGQPSVTVTLADYRRVGPVLVAFGGVVTSPDGAVLAQGRVSHVEYRLVDAASFVPPPATPEAVR